MYADAVRIRLVIADDHKLFRDGLKALLKKAQDMEVVGEACDGLQAVALTQRSEPDIVLMDIEMPYMNGLSAIGQLTAAGCASRVMVLSMREDEEAVRQAARARAWGYQIKNSERGELIAAVHSVYRGIRTASPSVAKFFFDALPPDCR